MMQINDIEKIDFEGVTKVDEFIQLIKDANERFVVRGCKNIQISIDGDYDGIAHIELTGNRIATPEEEDYYTEQQKIVRPKAKLVYEQRKMA